MNNHRLAKTIWILGVAAFAAPALAGWALLGFGHWEGCLPAAAECGRFPLLGHVFKQTLDLAWQIAFNGVVLVPLAMVVALAAIMARSPGRAFVGVFGGPTAALFLPVAVVMSAAYPGCRLDESGSSCTFWGVAMGNTFTFASLAPWLAYIIPPVGFAAALAVMTVAYIVKRQRA